MNKDSKPVFWYDSFPGIYIMLFFGFLILEFMFVTNDIAFWGFGYFIHGMITSLLVIQLINYFTREDTKGAKRP